MLEEDHANSPVLNLLGHTAEVKYLATIGSKPVKEL